MYPCEKANWPPYLALISCVHVLIFFMTELLIQLSLVRLLLSTIAKLY